MESEELVNKIMAEVLKNLADIPEKASFTKKSVTRPGQKAPNAANENRSSSIPKMTKENYPLAEKNPEVIHSNSGKSYRDLTFEKVKSGELGAQDFRVSPETLEMQAQVAESVDREAFARNLRRAAELIAVPDDRLLEIYDSLRPYRCTKAELYAIADELENEYGCKVNADFVREAADVYQQRNRLKVED